MVTDPPTNTARPPVANKQTGPITIHCAAKLSAQCSKTRLAVTVITSMQRRWTVNVNVFFHNEHNAKYGDS